MVLPPRHASVARVLCLAHALALAMAASAAAAGSSALRVTVMDSTNAVLPGASVTIARLAEAAAEWNAVTDGRGQARFSGLDAGRYRVHVTVEGFNPKDVLVTLARQSTDLRVTLDVAGVSETIVVRRPEREDRSDPRGSAFKRVLTAQDLAALPDDPEAFEQALRAMAGPGAIFRVDGFRSGQIPPKSAIAEVRFSFSDFSAEHHEYVSGLVDIFTKPGVEKFTGTVGTRFGASGLNARDASATGRSDSGEQAYYVTLGGPLRKGRSSFLASGTLGRQETARPIVATWPPAAGDTPFEVQTRHNALVSLAQAMPAGQILRAQFTYRALSVANGGIGGLVLPERALSVQVSEARLQAGLSGALGSRAFNQFRLTVSSNRRESAPITNAPAIVVMGAFIGGGGQAGGSRDERRVVLADDLDLSRGAHAVRLGFALARTDTGGDAWTNRRGTYTFGGLEDFLAGRPLTFTQRVTAQNFAFTESRAAAYVQDDVRVNKALTLSAGVRLERQPGMGPAVAVAPRTSLTWAPFERGSTAIRVGYGRYAGWIPNDVLEQVHRFDGDAEREVLLIRPTFPVPPDDIRLVRTATDRYLLVPDVRMSRSDRYMAGVDQRFGSVSLQLTYTDIALRGLLRARNLNPLLPAGTRQRPDWGNLIQSESTGTGRERSLNVRTSFRLRRPSVSVFADYRLGKSTDDTPGAFALPADPLRPELERGAADGDVRHRLQTGGIWHGPRDVFVFAQIGYTSGAPYTILTGLDDNADGFVNDRQPDVARNSARGAGLVTSFLRVSWRIPLQKGPGAPAAGGAASRRAFEIAAEVQNPLNRANPVAYVGVLSSPLFGKPAGFLPARRVQVACNVAF
jgi:hypothetical protein